MPAGRQPRIRGEVVAAALLLAGRLAHDVAAGEATRPEPLPLSLLTVVVALSLAAVWWGFERARVLGRRVRR